MAYIFLATLGQRPEAITIALDLLQERFQYLEIAILHTEPHLSGISAAYSSLKACFLKDYAQSNVRWHELTQRDGTPLIDIEDQASATNYYNAVYNVLADYKRERDTLHLLVAGGRKAMSIYATLAATLVFADGDRVWTVLSPAELIQEAGIFHAPVRYRARIQLVELPLLPARLWGDRLQNPAQFVMQRQNRRTDFMARLSKSERILAEMLTQHPYLSTYELAALLQKSPRTLENQFHSIYGKLISYLDLGNQITNKRQALIDILSLHH